ncbi:MAG: hypothetical protein P9X26_03145 [Candidatus Stygibacter frigidus]|nr:hypothetical protein [Candidatus Stygibacter frigidus]
MGIEIMIDNPKIQIVLQRLLLVEGKDEENFFNAFFKELDIDNIQIIVTGGKRKLKGNIEALIKIPNFEDIVTIGIIQDSDDNYNATMDRIFNSLDNVGLSSIKQQGLFSSHSPAIGIFIMPGEGEKGALEDLCLKAVHSDPVVTCVESFINCIRELTPSVSKISKRFCAAYLAGKKELVSSVGLAAHKKYWNFSSPVYSNLKDFLFKLSHQ